MERIEMESTEVQTALAEAVEEVLETMCFAMVLSSSETAIPAPAGSDPVHAMLRFEGTPSGVFHLSIPVALARAAGSGFLGRDEEEISDLEATEVVCELANMFCGSVLSRLEKETIFHLSSPVLVTGDAGFPFVGAGISRWFELEGGTLAVNLDFQLVP
jgi:CheY-specific phosphatase CheX